MCCVRDSGKSNNPNHTSLFRTMMQKYWSRSIIQHTWQNTHWEIKRKKTNRPQVKKPPPNTARLFWQRRQNKSKKIKTCDSLKAAVCEGLFIKITAAPLRSTRVNTWYERKTDSQGERWNLLKTWWGKKKMLLCGLPWPERNAARRGVG